MQDFNKIIDEQIATYEREKDRYPAMKQAATPLARPSAPILGRDSSELRLGLRNPEKANVIMLGEPGSGKTAYIQGFTYDEHSTQYLVLSVDVERLVKDSMGDKDTEMANGLLDLVSQVSDYAVSHDVIVVLFIDEFHRIAMVSPSAVEALKPILEKSAHNGFRVIAATTFEEYDEWIAPNRALDQRLLRITLPELPREAVINILKSRAKQYGVLELADPEVFGEIYDTSKQILISNSQPRASIDILLNVVGNITKIEFMQGGELQREYYTAKELNVDSEYPLSRPMLNRVIQRSYGIDIDNKVSIPEIKEALHKGILNQNQAVKAVISLLELSLTGFNDPTRPKSSFLSTGSTGVGKALDDNTEIYVIRDGVEQLMRHGDIKVGDYVYDRLGRPTKVTGVFPQGDKQVYRVEFSDGRFVDSADEHLWDVYSHKHKKLKKLVTGDNVMTSQQLLDSGLSLADGTMRYYVPNNRAVQFDNKDFTVHPYVVGVAVGDGCMTESAFSISGADSELIYRVGDLIGASDVKQSDWGYTWKFYNPSAKGSAKYFQTRDVVGNFNALYNKKSDVKCIPDEYLYGSVEQRWELIRGLFDTDGTIVDDGYRYPVSFTTISEKLKNQIIQLLYSLGYNSSLRSYFRESTGNVEYTVQVSAPNEEKHLFFNLTRKKEIAYKAMTLEKQRVKNYDYIGIKDIKVLDKYVPMTCIMVDNNEHLYQLANGIVTHNTEMAKIISETLGIPLKRFDMSRYSRPEDAIEFANALAQAAWSAPNGYILIDEVEKSTREAMNILLQVLDDARLTAANNPNRVISFSGNIINLTTNLGSDVYQHVKQFGDIDAEIDIELVYNSLTQSDVFETAVLGRIDKIVPFKPLPTSAMEAIAMKELNFNLDIVRTPDRQIFVSKDIIPYIVKDRTSSDTERGGARDAKRNIKNVVLQKLATYLSEEPDEVPVILKLDGVPRFKDETIADIHSADVEVVECYSNQVINNVLAQLSQRIGKQLENKGLFIPKTMSLNDFANEIVMLVKQGVYKFKTSEFDNDATKMAETFIDGVK